MVRLESMQVRNVNAHAQKYPRCWNQLENLRDGIWLQKLIGRLTRAFTLAGQMVGYVACLGRASKPPWKSLAARQGRMTLIADRRMFSELQASDGAFLGREVALSAGSMKHTTQHSVQVRF